MKTIGKIFLFLFAAGLIAGCIADSAEDSNLPWATNRGWEGLAPISPDMMHRYD